MQIEIEELAKEFGLTTALLPVSLTIPSGALVALLGLVTLAAKSFLEWRHGGELAATTRRR